MTERRSPLLERPVMRDQFRKELRGRLMSEAVAVLAPRRSRFSFPALLRPALAAAAILVLVGAGATSAAASSLPGDPLYGVKRASEDVQLALTFDDVARMQLLSQFTDRRLEELAQIAKQRPTGAPTATQEYADAVERFADALDDLRAATSEDKREAAQALAEAARAKHRAVLDAVKGQLPEAQRSDVQNVIDREEERTSSDGNPGRVGPGGGRPSNVPARPTPKK
jgi:Xaa-Pro aminopeptidase